MYREKNMATEHEDPLATYLSNMLLKRLVQNNGGAAPSAAPAEQPVSAVSKAKRITSIISETFKEPHLSEDMKYHCAKQQVIEEFGKEDARHYFKRTGPRAKRQTPDTPTEDTQAPPKLARDAVAPRLEPSVDKKEEPALTKQSILSVKDELQGILRPNTADAATQ